MVKGEDQIVCALELSVVIPCFNEESGLGELFRRVEQACKAVVAEAFELILVNDGSSDNTWNCMKTMAASSQRVVAVNLSRNFGHQLALSAGLQLCRGARVLILDADLQDPPELFAPMMQAMDGGFDVIYGQRTERAGETLFKRGTAHLFYRLLNRLVDIDIPTDTGDFRLMSRKAVDVLNSMPESHRFVRGMVSWIGLRQQAFPYQRAARYAGETKYPFTKMMRFALDAITGFSVRPLRIASYMGFLFGCAALLMTAYVVASFVMGRTVEGWTSLAVIILALGSAQLFVAGLMGEYLGRLYMQSKGRPLFVVQEIVTADGALSQAHNAGIRQ